MYVMYDDRGFIDPDEALILDTANDLNEVARANRAHKDYAYVWYEYELVDEKLINPIQRADLNNYGTS